MKMDRPQSDGTRKQHQWSPKGATRYSMPQTIERRRIEAMHWNTLGDTYSALGLMQRAITCYKRSRSIVQGVDPPDYPGVDNCDLLTKLGMAYQKLGKTRCAVSYHVESLHLARVCDDVERQLEALANLSDVYGILGSIHHAVACQIHRLSIYRLQGDRASEARVLAELGRGYDELGDIDEAIESCEHSLALAQEVGDRYTESMALASLGMAYGNLGYAQRTVAYGEQALRTARGIESQQAALECLGDGYLHLDEVQNAMQSYQHSLSIAEDLGDRLAIPTRCATSLLKR
jgi:tetratricopeptide (TPR) repeat protein